MASQDFTSRLYEIIPGVYRNRDDPDYGGNGHLLKYLKANAGLLDALHQTMLQRLADNFPDQPLDGGLACQDWLLPYFAELFDVRLVSPLAKGRRAEVANAVRWRQGKGTLAVLEEVAQAVAQWEVVLQEGYKRVAITPRLNVPRQDARLFGFSQIVPAAPPSIAARQPDLPAAMVDFRCPSGAIATDSSNPAAQQSDIDGDTRTWRQVSMHGAPCYPGSYEDVSQCTVDFRCADWRVGHAHPGNILFYTLPGAGFFRPNLPMVNWSDAPSEAFLSLIEIKQQGKRTVFRNRSLDSEHFVPVVVRRVIKLAQVPDGVGPADAHTWRFEGLILENRLEADSGRVELWRCAARKIEVHSQDQEQPVILAKDCLFKQLQAATGLSRLEYCTVLDSTLSEVVQASDCIFAGRIRKDHPTPKPPDKGCVRYSAVIKDQLKGGMTFSHVTREKPLFFADDFGDRGCGVLHPATSAAIRHGAEDGTEMGAYHHAYLSLLNEVMVDKLADYLPLGKKAVVIPDPRLLQMPQ
ncbi:hypothetical protein P2G88_03755 [Aliiglaciecola sp. CAU 1673]|uniref:hypothetical protein n=1 Tax=Aliiglaciecola sp. CAU 1673 TaxID=3032595 RepID=UPI0023DC232B|nr:hypothetical protein [Aliiglaciecola sp. CAU 1673]MDF2177359.1 hypothetical protein [Aliiglaciecola sp. CAU 1673]